MNDHPVGNVPYYEAHVTIEPVFDDRLMHAAALAQTHVFRIADLLMQKRTEHTAERSRYDTFMTGRHVSYVVLQERMINLVQDLMQQGYQVWRYKIESTLIDSKLDDSLNLLEDRNAQTIPLG